MTRRSITTNPPIVTCDVCGRTLLRGEQSDVFIAGGSRRNVCELCTGRAVHEGWIREGLDDVVARSRDGRNRRRGSLISRLRSRLAEGGPELERLGRDEPAGLPPERYDDLRYEDADGAGFDDPAVVHVPQPAAPAPAAPPAPQSAPPARQAPAREPSPDQALYETRSVRGVPTNAELKIARALELFNASEHTRTVAGVARSLGAPIVSARPSKTEGSVVTIVVAWELSWYRFEVDLGDEAAGVRVVAQGSELGELETIDQTANAAADDGGRLHPAASLT